MFYPQDCENFKSSLTAGISPSQATGGGDQLPSHVKMEVDVEQPCSEDGNRNRIKVIKREDVGTQGEWIEKKRDVAQLVERRTCNPKVVGLSLGGDYHQSLVSPSQKQWSPTGSGQTISSESKSGVSR